jgi:hypothetical protein
MTEKKDTDDTLKQRFFFILPKAIKLVLKAFYQRKIGIFRPAF